jgi:hypothetical protein
VVGAGGGKHMPLFLWGVLAERVRLRGKIGGLIWNPPNGEWRVADIASARQFYEAVDDWALDISEARFSSVPALRYGPPGRLLRRDPETQPLVTRESARQALERLPAATSLWTVVLDEFVRSPWPEEIVLVPALGARKAQREDDQRELERLRRLGVFDVP